MHSCTLLVGGKPPISLLSAEFHSAATRFLQSAKDEITDYDIKGVSREYYICYLLIKKPSHCIPH